MADADEPRELDGITESEDEHGWTTTPEEMLDALQRDAFGLRGLPRELDDPDHGRITVAGNPITFDSVLFFLVVGVTLGPGPSELVTLHLMVELFPEILVQDRLLRAGPPTISLPAVNPLGDPVLDVLGIRDDFDRTSFLQPAQALNSRG